MTYQRRHASVLASALCLLASMGAAAQSSAPEAAVARAGYEVTQILGLPDAKPNIKGQLTLSDTDLLFTNTEFKAEIPFTRITSVSVGDVRIETGGTTGQIARKVIPYGGGLALASVTQRSADLLTIEYVDLKGGYHGVVFFVPKFSAKVLSDRVASQLSTSLPQQPLACDGRPFSSTSVVVEPIAYRGVDFPAEYRVLLYEGLINELRGSKNVATYVRAGSLDPDLGCSGMKLAITVTGFKKGNQALRAATGPVGLFVGKTSIQFHVELTAADGHSVLAENMSNSKRMDTESLGVAKSVAKAISKKIHKVQGNKSAV